MIFEITGLVSSSAAENQQQKRASSNKIRKINLITEMEGVKFP